MAKTTVTFFSNYSQHELVRQPRAEMPVPSGIGWIQAQPAVKYKFVPAIDESGKMVGRCDVLVGQDKLVDTNGWLAPDAEQGIERDAPTALRAHKEFGKDFWLAPTPAAEVRMRIQRATVKLNVDDLLELLEQERQDFKRPDILRELEQGVTLVQEELQAMADAKAAAEAEAAAAPVLKAKAKPKAPAAA